MQLVPLDSTLGDKAGAIAAGAGPGFIDRRMPDDGQTSHLDSDLFPATTESELMVALDLQLSYCSLSGLSNRFQFVKVASLVIA